MQQLGGDGSTRSNEAVRERAERSDASSIETSSDKIPSLNVKVHTRPLRSVGHQQWLGDYGPPHTRTVRQLDLDAVEKAADDVVGVDDGRYDDEWRSTVVEMLW